MENTEDFKEVTEIVMPLVEESTSVTEPIEKAVPKTKSTSSIKVSNPTNSQRLVKEGDVIILTEDITYRGKVYHKATQGTIKAIYEPGTYAHDKWASAYGIKDTALYICVESNQFTGFVVSKSSNSYKSN